MAKANKTPAALLRGKRDKLDWGRFNFLENLLVFCALPSRSAPKESGVHFQISSKVKDEAICILFKIDRGADSLMPVEGPKPDYLVLYAARDRCICTIVEMKGTEKKNIVHGVEQIRALWTRLREELAEHLPGSWRRAITFQGILLTPYNSDVPRVLLEKERAAGLTILPLQYNHKAELHPYVSKKNALTERYVHAMLPRSPPELSPIEEILVRCALPERIGDDFRRGRGASERGDRAGVYVSFVDRYEGAKAHASLSASKSAAVVGFSSPDFKRMIEGELARLGLGHSSLDLRCV